jgi:hypothetical protein
MIKKRARIHPEIAIQFRKMNESIEAIAEENERLAMALKSERQARKALEKQELHIDDMPGKQLPFKFQINIPLEGGSATAQTGTVTVSRDGPFVARRLYATCIITDAPLLTVSDPGGDTWDYTDMEGRFCPISSRQLYHMWAFPADNLPLQFPIANCDGWVPPPLDFEWEYSDGGSERNRQDKPISGDILARHDEDGYFMNNEIFAAGTTISYVISPLRAVPTLTLSNTDTPPETDEGPLDLLFKVTFDGFKVLQPLEM